MSDDINSVLQKTVILAENNVNNQYGLNIYCAAVVSLINPSLINSLNPSDQLLNHLSYPYCLKIKNAVYLWLKLHFTIHNDFKLFSKNDIL